MKKYLILLMIPIFALVSCNREEEKVSLTRNFTLEITYENGDMDTLSYEYNIVVTKEIYESRGTNSIMHYRLYDGDSAPCIIVYKRNHRSEFIVCGVRKYNVLYDEITTKNLIGEK